MLLTIDEAAEFLRSRRAVFDGVNLVGFAFGKSREGQGRNVRSPSARAMSDGGRSIPLVRWTREGASQDRLQQSILAKYDMPDGTKAGI